LGAAADGAEESAEKKREEIRGNPLFAKNRFPRTLSGKNSYMASGVIGASVGADPCVCPER